MNKIKLLPILGIATLTGAMMPLVSCGCNDNGGGQDDPTPDPADEPTQLISGDFDNPGSGEYEFEYEGQTHTLSFEFNEERFNQLVQQEYELESSDEETRFVKVPNLFKWDQDEEHEYELKFSFKYLENYNPSSVELDTEGKKPKFYLYCDSEGADSAFDLNYDQPLMQSNSDGNLIHITSIKLNGEIEIPEMPYDSSCDYSKLGWIYPNGDASDHTRGNCISVYGDSITKNDWLDIKFKCTNPEKANYAGWFIFLGGFSY